MASTRTLVTALLKVWGVVWLISAISGFCNVILELFTQPAFDDAATQHFALFSSAATLLVTLGAAVVLLKFGEEISAFIVRADEQFAMGISATQLEAAFLGVLGTYFIVLGFREGAVIAYTLVRKAAWDQSGTLEYMWRNREREMAGAAVEFVAGWLLVLGRKGMAETWARLHPLGSSDELPPSDENAS